MNTSASIGLVVQFAAYEAVAGQFHAVEPEHLLMGILRLVELPLDQAVKLAPGNQFALVKGAIEASQAASWSAKIVTRVSELNYPRHHQWFWGVQVHDLGRR